MRLLLLAFCALATVALVTTFSPPAAATTQAPVCVGYAMCQPCQEGYAWVGFEEPLSGKWTCGQCEVCGNPI